jgi:hypothetical protein
VIFERGGVDVSANLPKVTTASVVNTEEVIIRGMLGAGSCRKKLLSAVGIAICKREDMNALYSGKKC